MEIRCPLQEVHRHIPGVPSGVMRHQGAQVAIVPDAHFPTYEDGLALTAGDDRPGDDIHRWPQGKKRFER